jgi:hypothetical protein
MSCAKNCFYIQSLALYIKTREQTFMETALTRTLMPLGLLAGLMLATGHTGGALAVAVAGGACTWMTRADALKRDLRRPHRA